MGSQQVVEGSRAGAVHDRVVRAVLLLGGGWFVAFGLWAFLSPAAFFDALAPFDPFNAHFLRDIGAFQVGLGAVLLLAARQGAAAAALLGVGTGAAFHAVGHVLDRDLGGTPASDIPVFTLVALVLLWAGWRATRSAV